MEKYFVLRNSLDNTLYFKDRNSDTRQVNESKKFINRSLAEKFITSHGLSEKYNSKMIMKRKLSESSSDNVLDELQSAVDDCKDMIENTIDLIDCLTDGQELDENVITDSDIEEIIRKLNKVKSYMAGISFYPSFYDSLGDGSGEINGGESNGNEESV